MMTEKSPETSRLTIELPEDVAERLRQVAAARKRAPSEVAVELLDRYLPRTQTGGKQGSIPYA